MKWNRIKWHPTQFNLLKFTAMQSNASFLQGHFKTVSYPRQTLDSSGQAFEHIKQFHLMIPRGSRPGDTIVFQGAGHETAETLPADVTFVLQAKPNNRFKIEGDRHLVFVGKPADWRMVRKAARECSSRINGPPP